MYIYTIRKAVTLTRNEARAVVCYKLVYNRRLQTCTETCRVLEERGRCLSLPQDCLLQLLPLLRVPMSSLILSELCRLIKTNKYRLTNIWHGTTCRVEIQCVNCLRCIVFTHPSEELIVFCCKLLHTTCGCVLGTLNCIHALDDKVFRQASYNMFHLTNYTVQTIIHKMYTSR